MKLRSMLVAMALGQLFLAGVNSAYADPRDWSDELMKPPGVEAAPTIPRLPTLDELPDGVVPVPGSSVNGQIRVEPGDIVEMPFTALVQKIAPFHLFWYHGYDGEARLCVRLPFPVDENQILFMGNCFSHEELAEMPSLKTPSKKPAPGVDGL